VSGLPSNAPTSYVQTWAMTILLCCADWLGDVQQNYGWALTTGGEVYIGKWAAGERNGNGLLLSSEGDVYYGDVRQGTLALESSRWCCWVSVRCDDPGSWVWWMHADAPSGWGAQQTIEWDETGETIKKGKWELGKCTRKRYRGGVAYALEPGKPLPSHEEDLVWLRMACSLLRMSAS